MSYSYIIVIDQGTHSTRAIVYDNQGNAIFSAKKRIALQTSNGGHAEQDGEEILASCWNVLKQAHQYIQHKKLTNVAIALATQRSTVIAWHAETGETLSPALSWLDTRAQQQLQAMSLSKDRVQSKTGLQITAHYGASKIHWLCQHNEKVKQARQQNKLLIGPLAAYLIFHLVESETAVVDYANAHRTMLWNLHTLDWDGELLDTFDVTADMLPKPVPSRYDYGRLVGLPYPMVLANGDQNSAMYGYGEQASQATFVNLGTGGFVMAACSLSQAKTSRLLNSISYSANNEQQYAVEGTVNGAGAALSWAQQHWQMENVTQQTWSEVDDVPVFINSVGGLGSPWWASNVKPEFLDQNGTEYTPAQRKAALMESIVFLLAYNIQQMKTIGVHSERLIVSGGLSADSELCQRLADLSAQPVMVSTYAETTSRGAAWLAMNKPQWTFGNSKTILANNNSALERRYQKFIAALIRLTRLELEDVGRVK